MQVDRFQAGLAEIVNAPSLVTGYFQGRLMNANGANIIIDQLVCNGIDWLPYLQSSPPGMGVLYGFQGNGSLLGDRFGAAVEIFDDHRHYIGRGSVGGTIIPKSQLANLAMAASNDWGFNNPGLGSLLTSIGFGDVATDITAALKLPSVDPLKVVKQFWGQIQGRSWDQAVVAATARAKAKDWKSGDQASKNDLITILVSTAINAKMLYDAGQPEYADLLRSCQLIANQMHLGNPTQTDIDKMKTTAAVELEPIILIVAVIASAMVAVGIVITLCFLAGDVIDNVLSKIECDRELIRLHNDYNNDVAAGNKDSSSRDKLLEAQQTVANGCVKPKPPFSPWPYVAGAGVLTTAILGVVYRKQIGNWIERKL